MIVHILGTKSVAAANNSLKYTQNSSEIKKKGMRRPFSDVTVAPYKTTRIDTITIQFNLLRIFRIL